jgi:predicted nucleic acid-binding protein
MDEYDDHPMGFADASLVAAAEALRITKVFTLDRNDFATYRFASDARSNDSSS